MGFLQCPKSDTVVYFLTEVFVPWKRKDRKSKYSSPSLLQGRLFQGIPDLSCGAPNGVHDGKDYKKRQTHPTMRTPNVSNSHDCTHMVSSNLLTTLVTVTCRALQCPLSPDSICPSLPSRPVHCPEILAL